MKIETNKKKAVRIPIWSKAHYLRLYHMVEAATGIKQGDMAVEQLSLIEVIVTATREAVYHLEHLKGDRPLAPARVNESTGSVTQNPAVRAREDSYDYIMRSRGLLDVCDLLGVSGEVVRSDIKRIIEVAMTPGATAALAEQYTADIQAINTFGKSAEL